MRILIILILSGMALGCSSKGEEIGPDGRPLGVPQSLITHYEAFQEVMDMRGLGRKAVRVPAKFEALEGDKVGYCRFGPDFRYLAVDPKYWKDANHSEREVLVFHELGHCVLGLDHFDTLDKFGMPESIMISSMNLGSFLQYSKNRSRYINQLLDMFELKLK